MNTGILWLFFLSTVVSTERERESAFVALYSDNYAWIEETRKIAFPGGRATVYLEDLPGTLEPSTLHIRGDDEGLRILSYRFENQLVEAQSLLNHFVGKEIEVAVKVGEKEEVHPARLLSASGIVEIGGKIHLQPPGRIILPLLPEEYLIKPRLVMEVEAPARSLAVSVGYLASGLNWGAEYLLDYSEKGNSGDLTGTIQVSNQVDWKIESATVLLIAGEVRRVVEAGEFAGRMKREMALMAAPAPAVEERPFFEYHLYRLPFPISFLPRSAQFVHFLEAKSIPIHKKYQTIGETSYYTGRYPEPLPMNVGVFLEWENQKELHLGVPLPAGKVRIFQKEEAHSILLGEDRIPHTPEGEHIRVQTGNAFDIRAERLQTDFKRISSTEHEVSFEITLRNHRQEEIQVEVLEPMQGDWQIVESNFAPRKVSAQWVKFVVPVKPDGENTLRYRVRVKF
ncbi:MAG: DUF4139 domain-containing protein [bacterium JZ-2024 1]